MNSLIHITKLIDAFILNAYNRFSHWFQKTFGPTNFSLARVCLIFLCLYNLIAFAIPLVILKDFRIVVIILAMIVVMMLFLGFRICTRSEKIYDKGENNFLNKNEKTFLKWRVYSVAFFSFRAIVFIHALVEDSSVALAVTYGLLSLHHILIAFFFYFVSCTPLPPGESKIKAKLKALKERVSGFLLPQPDAVPV